MTISEIVENFLYVGPARDTKDIQRMERLGITHIVSCAGTICSPERYKIAMEHFEDDEDVNIRDIIDKVFWFIEKANNSDRNRLLVVCLAGKSRSVSIVLSYFLKLNYLSLASIFNSVQAKRPEIRPNSGFMNQLLDLEFELRGSQSFSREKKEWQSLVRAPKREFTASLNGCKGLDPSRRINLDNKINSTIKIHFISVYLDQHTLNTLLSKHLEATNQSVLIEYSFFCKEVQHYLSESTNKASKFIEQFYYIDWLDITKYLENSIESLVNNIDK